MPKTLTTIPTEVLNAIIATIPSQQALASLAQCSHWLYRCTIPHLYRHVAIQEGEEPQGKLRKLASVIIRRPDLAGLIQIFTLHIPFRKKEGSWEYITGPDTILTGQTLAPAIHPSSLTSLEETVDALGQFPETHMSHHDFILSLLLPVLLKVKKVELGLNSFFPTFYLQHMIQKAARREMPFHLRQSFEELTVFILHHDKRYTWSLDLLASLLQLPAIQEISGYFTNYHDEEDWHIYEQVEEANDSDDDDDDEYDNNDDDEGDDDEDDDDGQDIFTNQSLSELDSSSSPLRILDLSAHNLTKADLDHILRAPKALETFTYKVWQESPLNFKSTRNSLETQSKSLEWLEYYDNQDFLAGRENPRPMASWTGFNALKMFKTEALFLTETIHGADCKSLLDIFPANLETLHLIRFRPSFEILLEALEYLLARKSSEQIPSLTTLVLEEAKNLDANNTTRLMDVLRSGTQENAIEWLSMTATAQGISFDVIELP